MTSPRLSPANRAPRKFNKLRWLWFHIRNFVSGRIYRMPSNAKMRCEVKKRRRTAARRDPVWKESWWVLERRYSKLAKRMTKLELKYLMAKDLLKRYSDDTKTFDHNGEGKHEQSGDTDK